MADEDLREQLRLANIDVANTATENFQLFEEIDRLRAELAEAKRTAEAAIVAEQERGKSWAEKALRVQAELARIATELEAERDKVREAEGATLRDENVINGIVNGLGIALRIVRNKCSLCDGSGIVPGTEEPDINASGEPCDCQLPTT